MARNFGIATLSRAVAQAARLGQPRCTAVAQPESENIFADKIAFLENELARIRGGGVSNL